VGSLWLKVVMFVFQCAADQSLSCRGGFPIVTQIISGNSLAIDVCSAHILQAAYFHSKTN